MQTRLLLKSFFALLLPCTAHLASAQDAVQPPRSLTTEEYKKAKTFSVKDLDKDTYVKFENTYVLDRYELRKPYFVTGDDGLKKRIDLYKLLLKDGQQELGTLIFYTSETGKRYIAVLPNAGAEAAVWEQYFNDIHAIDKEEKNFVLKLSYVLSKEFAFQQYKSAQGGKDAKIESATYGTQICFPGHQSVRLANGRQKLLQDVQKGDQVITVDPATGKETLAQVTELTEHEQQNYALTTLLLVAAEEKEFTSGLHVRLTTKEIKATPNHPVQTTISEKKMGDIIEGEKMFCLDERTGTYKTYTVLRKTEAAGGVQKVYNLVLTGGKTLLVNGVVVLQK